MVELAIVEIRQDTLREVEGALRRYEAEVDAAMTAGRLAKTTHDTYLLHARNFVRWLKGDFEPGGAARG